MLVQFNLKNHRSISHVQTLSLVRGKGSEHQEANSFDVNTASSLPLLRSAVVYGPNAAGKSNVINALKLMRQLVVTSATEIQPGDLLKQDPFLLDEISRNDPTEFEVIFLADGVRYQYGFAYSTERITEEWLFAYPLGRKQHWFGREWNAESKEYDWTGVLAQKVHELRQKTRENNLFLSVATHWNNQKLMVVYDWFKKHLRLAGVGGWAANYTSKQCAEGGLTDSVLGFLKAADLGISGLSIESESLEQKLRNAPQGIAALFSQSESDVSESEKYPKFYSVRTVHESVTGTKVEFDLEEQESHGTQKLFAFAGPWLDVLDKGYVLFVDELNDKLHPKIVRFLIELFHNPTTNPKNAQLIFSTHDTSILNQNIFRRDQIWFCEKNSDQATLLYPLTDFSPRKGAERENLELGYLAGRYGAIPFIGELSKPELTGGV